MFEGFCESSEAAAVSRVFGDLAVKSKHQCPKCASTEVVLLTGSSVFASIYGRNSLVEKFACTNCGFLEEYLVDRKELAELKQKHLRG